MFHRLAKQVILFQGYRRHPGVDYKDDVDDEHRRLARHCQVHPEEVISP